ncbi:MAG: outer membrane protein assembly factor BamE [Rhizobiales bacterium]|nr:outer membrane protein assembly factor BamE [Hyphomicrobiales bacterium]
MARSRAAAGQTRTGSTVSVLPVGLGGAPRRATGRAKIAKGVLAAVFAGGLLGACAGETIRHGHHFSAVEIQQIQPGMSQEQVRLTLGTPITTSTMDGGAYYYISTTKKQVAFMAPEVVDRQVLAVYFDPFGSVTRVAQYGLEDGRVVNFSERETPPQIAERGLIGQLFRGIGRAKVDPNAS